MVRIWTIILIVAAIAGAMLAVFLLFGIAVR